MAQNNSRCNLNSVVCSEIYFAIDRENSLKNIIETMIFGKCIDDVYLQRTGINSCMNIVHARVDTGSLHEKPEHRKKGILRQSRNYLHVVTR